MLGTRLVAIDRSDGERLRGEALGTTTTLAPGDTLWFSGGLDAVGFLMRVPGLGPAAAAQVAKLGIDTLERRLVQASVAPRSPVAGQTVREVAFRARYDAVVIAIARAGAGGSHLPADVRDVRLKAGDVLLLDTGANFARAFKDDRAFNLISEVRGSRPLKFALWPVSTALLVLMVATQLAGGALNKELINLFPAAVLTAGLMVITRW